MQFISTMVRKENFSKMSIHTFTIVLSLVEVLRQATCLVIKPNPIIPQKDSLVQNVNQHLHQYYYKSGPNITNVVTIEDDDSNYPYEEILQLVEDTKRVIRSTNETEKEQLNLDPSLFDNYLEGDLSDSNLDFNISPQIPPFFSDRPGQYEHESCPIDLAYEIPRRLRAIDGKEYFIVNVGNKLRQKYNSIVCKKGAMTCGNSAPPESYSYRCSQTYGRVRNFISIPVDGPINLQQQREVRYHVPDNCICKAIRH